MLIDVRELVPPTKSLLVPHRTAANSLLDELVMTSGFWPAFSDWYISLRLISDIMCTQPASRLLKEKCSLQFLCALHRCGQSSFLLQIQLVRFLV